MSQKNLHIHAVPILLASLAVLMIAASLSFASGGYGPYIPTTASSKALITAAFQIKPQQDGLASINLSRHPANVTPLAVSNSVASHTLMELSANPARDSLVSIH